MIEVFFSFVLTFRTNYSPRKIGRLKVENIFFLRLNQKIKNRHEIIKAIEKYISENCSQFQELP